MASTLDVASGPDQDPISGPGLSPRRLSSAANRPVTLAVLVGNRGFFPDYLCSDGRKTILSVLERLGFRVVITPQPATIAANMPRNSSKLSATACDCSSTTGPQCV